MRNPFFLFLRSYFSFVLLVVFPLSGYAQSAKATPPQIVLVDDFNNVFYRNRLGGMFGAVATAGDVKFDYEPSILPQLSSLSNLKIDYDFRGGSAYAFLWMKLGDLTGSNDMTRHLDLRGYKYLSFRYRSEKGEPNFKVELHEDRNGDGWFVYGKDRSSDVYTNRRGYPDKDGWYKILIPLKLFSAIKDWSKVLEIVFVFEKDRMGDAAKIQIDDILFIKTDLPLEKKKTQEIKPELLTDVKIQLEKEPMQSNLRLQNENRFTVKYKPGRQMGFLESLSMEVKSGADPTWHPVATTFNPGPKSSELVWEIRSFAEQKDLGLRLVAHDFYGRNYVMAGPFENLSVSKLSDEQFLDLVERKAFLYFLENQDKDTGLFLDTSGAGFGDASIAVTGFGLSALVIGTERGWISKKEAKARTKLCLDTILNLAEDKEGFYYHFLSSKTARRSGKAELSSVDSAILFAGVLTAGEYFGGKIKKQANKIYGQANWPFFLNQNPDEEHYLHFHHGWTPEQGLSDYYWDYFTDETLLLDLLAIGSPTHPVSGDVFYTFLKRKGTYGQGQPFIYSWHGSLFSYQYAHAWFDFRGKVDREGVDWWQNSVDATLSNRQFVMDHASEFKTYGADMWGITSMRLPDRYVMHYGAMPNGQVKAIHDGTISPSGPGGSIELTPYLSLRALKALYMEHPESWGIYGFKDSINLDRGWTSPIYYGLGEGILLLGLENLRTGLIWNNFSKNKSIQEAFKRTGFKLKEVAVNAPKALDAAQEKDEATESFDLNALLKKLETENSESEIGQWVRAALTENLQWQDWEKLYSALERKTGGLAAANMKILILLGRLQSKILQSLEANDLEIGRLYLKNADRYATKALTFFEEALKKTRSEKEKVIILKEVLNVHMQIQSMENIFATEDELSATLRQGIESKAFEISEALQMTDELSSKQVRRLRQDLWKILDFRQRRLFLSYLDKKAEKSLNSEDYPEASLLYEEQVSFLDKEEDRQVNMSNFLEKVAKAFITRGQLGEAESFYRKILEKYSTQEEKQKIHYQLGELLEKKGDRAGAVKEFNQLMKDNPAHPKAPEILARMANLESGLGNRDGSIALLKRITSQYPSDPQAEEAQYMMGMVYFHAERYDKAVQTWESFIKKYPKSRRLSVVQDYLERADNKQK